MKILKKMAASTLAAVAVVTSALSFGANALEYEDMKSQSILKLVCQQRMCFAKHLRVLRKKTKMVKNMLRSIYT